MKGQSSLELLVTLGVVVAFTIPVLFLLLSVTSIGYEDTAKAQADATSRSLADTMNSVYAQGPGAQRQVLLNVPASTLDVYAQGNEAVVRIKTTSGVFDAASPTFASISGGSQDMGKRSGLFTMYVCAIKATGPDLGKVKLSDTPCN